MNVIQIKNNIINLDHVRKFSYQHEVSPKIKMYDHQLFNIEFIFTNGDSASYEVTYEKFQQLLEKYDDLAFVIDNKVNAISLKTLKVFAGTGEPQRAEMTLDVFGELKKASETGDGPVDAIFKCIKKLYPHEVNLQLYQVHAVTEGTDAQATVSVRIEENGKTTVGQAADTDTLVASANAYINALNKMIIKRDKTAPGYSPEQKKEEKVKGI